MLTFEWDKDSEQLEVHTDNKGLEVLIKKMSQLKSVEGKDHLHLMTEAWGGSELSDEKQNDQAILINNVKIFKWVDK